MSKVLTFSRVFPSYHPKKGQPTYFVEKIYNSLYEKDGDWSNAIDPDGKNKSYVIELNNMLCMQWMKHHTIRNGNRWRVGDKFSPRVWSDNPYKSKQIIIAPDIEIKKIWNFKILCDLFYIDGESFSTSDRVIERLAKNDGLSLQDLIYWFPKFPKQFSGQIICWNKNINY